MIDPQSQSLPKVQLNRMQTVRMVAVGIVVAFMVLRVVPDVYRLVSPLGLFDYATNDDAVVVKVPATRPKGSDALYLGDRVRIDRIAPFDRKPGLAGVAYTQQNFDRRLPIERDGRERVLDLKATAESPASRAIVLLRIVLYVAAVGFGALLLIVNPTLATFAFFVFCLGGSEPTSFSDNLFDMPWRQIPPVIGNLIAGQAPLALLLFALSLSLRDLRARYVVAAILGVAAFAMGADNALAFWRLNYGVLPAQALRSAYDTAEMFANILTAVAFAVAFLRTRGAERHRTAWIIAAFVIAGLGRFTSEHLFPGYLNFWQNGTLLALSILPVIVVWIAVVKHHFFDVDFVVSRALVYTSITAAVIFIVGGSEELMTYIFYNNTNLAYGVIILVSLVIGSTFGRVRGLLEHFVDRFVFRGRHAQRTALERVASNLLDAEDTGTVFKMLLHDVPSILDLSFSGVMTRTDDGGYRLEHHWNWPDECVNCLTPDHQLTRDINSSRGVLPEDAVQSTMVKSLFPNERLTYAAPLYYDRTVSALVLYGHSVTGLDIDPEERVTLVRLMANASIALNAIELAMYRKAFEAAAALGASGGSAEGRTQKIHGT
ncbi:MAG TPA: hypothetical protein VGP41_08300 [Candidatus Lustribacter sp.]|nr:hypothetical protein [Candidatus Lustribacter sp.]